MTHGVYDPHPADGVIKPLRETIANFQWHLLKKCGHKPWKEKQAKEDFYHVLKSVIN